MSTFESSIKVAGRAVEYWGSESISSDISALFELVKNARDADATEVKIDFRDIGKKGSIIITDDGTGMTKSDIDDKWLVAATDNKVKNTITSKGRKILGEKGIGRFSCQRLSKRTTMISRPIDANEKITLEFDWDKYNEPGVTFDQVKHVGRIETNDGSGHGLDLILDDLRSDWTKKIDKIPDELGVFVMPLGAKDTSNFKIIITENGLLKNKKELEPKILKIAPLSMKAIFDGKTLKTKIYEEGFSTPVNTENQDRDATCGPFKFDLYFYPQDVGGHGKLDKYYKKNLPGESIRDFLSESSGVYLYRDGVWVKPLGQKNDWLGLESGRLHNRTKTGLAQVYGLVHITKSDNPDIVPTAHRETLQETEGLKTLKDTLWHAMRIFDDYRRKSKPATRETNSSGEVKGGNNIDVALKILKTKKDDTMTAADVEKTIHHLATAKKFFKESKKEEADKLDRIIDERQHEYAVFTIGLLTSYVSHEIMTPLKTNMDVISEIKNTMDSTNFSEILPEDLVKQGFDWIDSLKTNTDQINHFVSFVSELSQHIATSVSQEGAPSQVKVSDIWDTVATGFEQLASKLNISVNANHHVENLKIKTNRIDIESILTNLFLNSIEVLKKKDDGARRIEFESDYTSEGLKLKFSDNGAGIDPKSIERVFEPFFTEHPSQHDDTAHGQGLGLTIVKKILESHSGIIDAESPGDLGMEGVTFTIKIPKNKAMKVIRI